MNIEQVRVDIADELRAVHDIISTILESFPDDEPEHKATNCNDDAMLLLEYACGYVDSASKCLGGLSNHR